MWDIREAYGELGSSTEGWVDVVGRPRDVQLWRRAGHRAFRLAQHGAHVRHSSELDLHHPGVKVSIFAASVITCHGRRQIDHHIEGNNIYGIYSSFTHLLPARDNRALSAVASRSQPNVPLPETEGRGQLNEVTGGARVAGTFLDNFDYDVEMNKQTGSLGADTIDAWAGHWNAGYTFQETRIHPRVFAEYNYASGNKNPDGNTWGTHDQIYPSAHDKMSFADQFGWRNIEDFRAGVDEKIATKSGP